MLLSSFEIGSFCTSTFQPRLKNSRIILGPVKTSDAIFYVVLVAKLRSYFRRVVHQCIPKYPFWSHAEHSIFHRINATKTCVRYRSPTIVETLPKLQFAQERLLQECQKAWSVKFFNKKIIFYNEETWPLLNCSIISRRFLFLSLMPCILSLLRTQAASGIFLPFFPS